MGNPQLNGSIVLAEGASAERRWRRHTILSEAVLEPLYELNRAYLHTLARIPRQWHAVAASTRLPDPVCLALMSLAPDRRSVVARCPFSLFSARFHDEERWAALVNSSGVAEVDAHRPADDVYSPLGAFAQPALFFVWHLVRSNPSAARVVFGMSERTLAVFRSVTLTRLQRIALDHPEIITPRWPERSTFWKVLLDVSPRVGEECANAAHLLGLQMLAAELSGGQPDRVRNLRASRP